MRRALLILAVLLLTLVPLPTEAAPAAETAVIQISRGRAAVASVTNGAEYVKTPIGAGTESNPFIIDGKFVTANDKHGIVINDSRAHVKIINVNVTAGGKTWDAIRLVNATNVTIEGSAFQFNRACVYLENSYSITIRRSEMRACVQGIVLKGSSATISENKIAVSDEDVRFEKAPRSVFRKNNLSIASGQIGFSFADEKSYDQDIDNETVVNFVPMRWHVGKAGTSAASPVKITGETVSVKGMTNVAQIMCYKCSHVHIDRATATSGTHAGVAVVDSKNVTVNYTLAEANGGPGVELRRSVDSRVLNATSGANGIGILLNVTERSAVRDSTAQVNSNDGVRVTYGNDSLVHNVTAEKNANGLNLDRTNRSRVAAVTLTQNTQNGAIVRAGVLQTIEASTASRNGISGIELAGPVRAVVRTTESFSNAKNGILLSASTQLARIESNNISRNGESGIRVSSATPLNEIVKNAFASQPAHIRLTNAEDNIFDANTVTLDARRETGFYFDDETSYNNQITTANIVGATPVQWHVALAGTTVSPVVLRDIRVEQENITNVAQLMLYKGSYVRIEDAVVSNGTRGIYVLRSASVNVTDSTAAFSRTGIELRGTLTAGVADVDATYDTTGILVADTSNATISGIRAFGSTIAVDFADTKSRGSILERVNASGVLGTSVRDPSFVVGPPPKGNNLIIDAGLDKSVGAQANMTFADAIATSRFGSERIVRQSWDFGDGATVTSDRDALLRPQHAYETLGQYVATFTVETAGGLSVADTVLVYVLAPPEPPTNLTANSTARTVKLAWNASEDKAPVIVYRVYRGNAASNLTFLKNTTDNKPVFEDTSANRKAASFYAVSAVTNAGEGAKSAAVRVAAAAATPAKGANTTTTTPAEENATPFIGAAGAAIAIALAATVFSARRRQR